MGSVSESDALRVARDAYLKGEEDATFREERPEYEERVLEAEHVARTLLDIVGTPHQQEVEDAGE